MTTPANKHDSSLGQTPPMTPTVAKQRASLDPSKDIAQLRVALDKLYRAALTRYPLVEVEPSNEAKAESIRDQCFDWTWQVDRAYGCLSDSCLIPGPTEARDFVPRKLPGSATGVLAFFAWEEFGDLAASDHPSVVHFLGRCPRELSYPCGEQTEQYALSGIRGWKEWPGLMSWEVSACLVRSKNVGDVPLHKRWDKAVDALLALWKLYRGVALRLVSWVEGRLAEYEGAVLPSGIFFRNDDETKLRVKLAGVPRSYALKGNEGSLLGDLLTQGWGTASSDTRYEVGLKVPELHPHIDQPSKTDKSRKKGSLKSDPSAVKYTLASDVHKRFKPVDEHVFDKFSEA